MTEEKGDSLTTESTMEETMEEFQEFLSELSKDENLSKFRIEYEKLTNALKKSHQSEKQLMGKCKELNAEILSNSEKVLTAQKLQQDNQATISSLEEEVEKARKSVSSAFDRERQLKETVAVLEGDISRLQKEGQELADSDRSEANDVSDLLKIRDDLTKERDELLSEVVNARQNISQNAIHLQELEESNKNATETISQLQQDIQVLQNEVSREARRKERLEKESRQLRADLEARQADVKELSQQSQHSREEQQRLEQQLREQKTLTDKATKELEQLQVRNTRLQQENEQNSLNLEQMSLELQQKAFDLKMKEDEVNQMRQEISKLTKMREATQRKIRQLEDQKAEVEQERETLKNGIAGLERELESSKKQLEMDKKAVDRLTHEKDLLNKNLTKASVATEKQLNLLKIHEQSKKYLDQENMNYRDEAQKQRKIIYQLERERDRYINEASDLTHKVLQLMEDIKAREMQVFDNKKIIAEAETKITQQQNLYETVRSDRNLYSKNLTEAQADISELKKKKKAMSNEIEQLKEEVGVKEATLAKEKAEFQRVETEKEALKTELQKMKQQAQETKQFIDNQKVEEKKLLKILDDSDAERLRQKRELEQVTSERDILATQLTRRNDELALLYEKSKIQQSILNKGEIQYNQRIEDIRLLKRHIKRLRREKTIMIKTAGNIEDLRREVNLMQKELLKERARCSALEKEVETPTNMHRWRKLQATDPSTYMLIQKIHSLQKRLIKKTEEVVEKELLLQEKEKLYMELKHSLARRPGPEAVEQLQMCQQTLRKKTKELKALSAELNMLESQTKEYQEEIDRLNEDLQNVKKRYLAQKRKEQQSREKGDAAQVRLPVILPQRTDGPRCTGGGFCLRHGGKTEL